MLIAKFGSLVTMYSVNAADRSENIYQLQNYFNPPLFDIHQLYFRLYGFNEVSTWWSFRILAFPHTFCSCVCNQTGLALKRHFSKD